MSENKENKTPVTYESIKNKLYTKNEYGVVYQDPEAKLSSEEVAWLAKTYGINTTWQRSCINCQARQVMKYPEPKDVNGKLLAKKFVIPCSGIQNELPVGSQQILTNMVESKGIDPERAKLVLRATQDPVAWCELMFDFSDKTKGTDDERYLRSYQKEQLRCTSRKMVLREGRRTGKALAIDTPIPTPKGWKTMETLKEGDQVFDENGEICNVTFATDIMYNHSCYKVSFSDGTHLIADEDHQWGVITSYSKRMSRAKGISPFLTKTTKDMIGDLYDGYEFKYRIPICFNVKYPLRDVSYDPYILGWLLGSGEWHRLSGILIEEKIPEAYIQNTTRIRTAVLNGIMDACGSSNRDGVLCAKIPKDLYPSFESLLNTFGVAHKKEDVENHIFVHFRINRVVFLRNRSSKELTKKPEKSIEQYRYIVSIEPVSSVPVKCISVDSKNRLYLAGKNYIATHNTFAVALKLLYLAFNMKFSRNKSDGTIFSTGPEIIVATPYSSQVLSIFTEMEKLLLSCPELASQVTSGTAGNLFVKTPFLKMEFSNFAKISGFVTGVGKREDGSAGGTLRGQNADIVYLDEMDMIPDAILEKVIIPLLFTRKNTRLIASSTPIGKRGLFYKWCKEDPEFKEDHLPTTVTPQWEQAKSMLKSSSEEAIRSEYMAEFIEGGHGVFKPSYVYSAREEYDYAQTATSSYLRDKLKVRRPDMLMKCIGIDWNKNAGTEFVVVGYDPDDNHWIVLETVNVSSSEFSAVKWKEEVIRLNYKWKPAYIYADEGYGHTIIEDLKVMAHTLRKNGAKNLQQAETIHLLDRLKSFNFSSKVSLRSPIDGTLMEKSSKEFLVENAVRILEDGSLSYSVNDEVLKNQLLNYVVLRRAPTTGKPVYGFESSSIADHRLDALMLALGGLHLELSEYSPAYRAISVPKFLDSETLEKRKEASEKKKDQNPNSIVSRIDRGALATILGSENFVIEGQGGAGSFKESGPSPGPNIQSRPDRFISERGKKENSKRSEVWEHYRDIPRSTPHAYETDTEHLLQNEPSTFKVVSRGRDRASKFKRR